MISEFQVEALFVDTPTALLTDFLAAFKPASSLSLSKIRNDARYWYAREVQACST